MSWHHERFYPWDRVFRPDELIGITPSQIRTWMWDKACKKENAGPDDYPILRAVSLLQMKKGISCCMPNETMDWNPTLNQGNPTCSSEVKGLIKFVHELDYPPPQTVIVDWRMYK